MDRAELRNIFRQGFSTARQDLTLTSIQDDSHIDGEAVTNSGQASNVYSRKRPRLEEKTDRELLETIASLIRIQNETLAAQGSHLERFETNVNTRFDRVDLVQGSYVWQQQQILQQQQVLQQERQHQQQPTVLQLEESTTGPMSELQAIVKRKKEEGYRFREYTDFKGAMSVGWMKPVPTELGTPVSAASNLGGDTDLRAISSADMVTKGAIPSAPESVDPQTTMGLQMEDIIDTSRFEVEEEEEEDNDRFFPGLQLERQRQTNTAGESDDVLPSSPLSPAGVSPPLTQSQAHDPDRALRAGSNLTDIFAIITKPARRQHRRKPSSSSAVTPQAPIASTEPIAGPSSSRLRPRIKKPDYVHHPMDEVRRRIMRQEAEEAREESPDSVRGLSTAPLVILAKSDGWERPGAKRWSKWGDNTLRGRMVSYNLLSVMTMKLTGVARNQL